MSATTSTSAAIAPIAGGDRRAVDRSPFERHLDPGGDHGAGLEDEPRDRDDATEPGDDEQRAGGLGDAERREWDATERDEHPDDLGERMGGGSADDAPRTGRRHGRRRGVQPGEQHRRHHVARGGQEPHPAHAEQHPGQRECEAEDGATRPWEITGDGELERDDPDDGQRPEPPRWHRQRDQQTTGDRGRQARERERRPLVVRHQAVSETRSAKTTMRCAVDPGGWHAKSVAVGVAVGLTIQTADGSTISTRSTA